MYRLGNPSHKGASRPKKGGTLHLARVQARDSCPAPYAHRLAAELAALHSAKNRIRSLSRRLSF